MTTIKIVESYWNPDDGLRADVMDFGNEYSVRLVDTDCGRVVSGVRRFKDEGMAHAYARRLVS